MDVPIDVLYIITKKWLLGGVKHEKRTCVRFSVFKSDPAGTRTQGPYIKSVLLYQLSYEINCCSSLLGVQK